jgi:hypothetical protein
MPKKTAIEWLAAHLNADPFISTYVNPEMINRAIEMEQEQIEDAFNAGVNSEDFFYPSTGKLECEIYYEETYKK